MSLWSYRDAGDPPRVSGSAGALAGCVRCRAGRLAGNLSSVGLWTPAGSGSDPQPSARTRCVSERPGTPSPWCSRHLDRGARPHSPQRRSGRATFCHPRHAYDVPASPRTRDSRRRQGISAVVLWKDGSCRRSSGAAHVVDDSARLRRPDPCPASASGSESGALRRTRESGLEGRRVSVGVAKALSITSVLETYRGTLAHPVQGAETPRAVTTIRAARSTCLIEIFPRHPRGYAGAHLRAPLAFLPRGFGGGQVEPYVRRDVILWDTLSPNGPRVVAA